MKREPFTPDWDLLQHLRRLFLGEHFFENGTYWKSTNHLIQYDHSFAERIGWKWDNVLNAIKKELSLSSIKTVVDWGCGTGKASERFFYHFSSNSFLECYLWDQSPLARSFSKNKLESLYPQIQFLNESPQNLNNDFILLISHVLNELSHEAEKELFNLIAKAKIVIWIEPGKPKISRKLIEIREQLLPQFTVVAPCPHQKSCGLLRPEQETNWCHFFAHPPSEVFQSAFWKEFSIKLGIDLRSLPISYLVLQKSLPLPLTTKELVLGRSRHFKGYSLVLTCSESGVRERRLLKRNQKELIDLTKEKWFRLFIP
jgi:hypothetical protein